MRALLCLTLCSCWITRGSQVYPVRDHYSSKIRPVGDHTAWLVDQQHWLTAENGQLGIIDEAIAQGPPLPIGFVDQPLKISVAAVGGDRVWIPYVDAGGMIRVVHTHMRNRRVLAATLPERAIGAPVLHDCADPFDCDGGWDAVVGVVTDAHRMAALPELSDYVVAHHLQAYLNKEDIPGASLGEALGTDDYLSEP